MLQIPLIAIDDNDPNVLKVGSSFVSTSLELYCIFGIVILPKRQV